MRISFTIPNTLKNYVIFKGISAQEKREEVRRREIKIRAALQDAINIQKKLSMSEVKQQTGLSENEIRTVFRNYYDTAALWQSVRSKDAHRATKAEAKQKKKDIEDVLLAAKNNDERMTIGELAEKTGVTFDSADYYIANDEKLSSLWFWVKAHEFSHYTQDEVQEQIALIKEQMEAAIKKKRAITNEEIMRATHLDRNIVEHRISTNASLSELAQKIAVIADKNYRLEVNSIKKVLQEAKVNGLKITQQYISQVTTIPKSTVKKRIDENEDLSRLFEKVRAREHTNYTKDEAAIQNAKIAAILNEALQNGQNMTIEEVSAKLEGLKRNTVSSRINGNKELKELWNKVKKPEPAKPTKDEIKEQIEKIEQILTELKNKNEKITLEDLAKAVNLTSRITHTRIKGSESLSALWDITCSKTSTQYSKEDIEVQDVMIERILSKRIQDKMKPSYYQMSQYLDLSEGYIKQRIKNNLRLSALFERAKQTAKD